MAARALTSVDFDEAVSQSDLVLVDFWGDGCAPCRRLAPIVDTLAAELQGCVTVGKMNVNEHPDVAIRFGIRSVPTLVLFRSGVPVETLIGWRPREDIEQMVARSL